LTSGLGFHNNYQVVDALYWLQVEFGGKSFWVHTFTLMKVAYSDEPLWETWMTNRVLRAVWFEYKDIAGNWLAYASGSDTNTIPTNM
jgi:hypothetical protein